MLVRIGLVDNAVFAIRLDRQFLVRNLHAHVTILVEAILFQPLEKLFVPLIASSSSQRFTSSLSSCSISSLRKGMWSSG